MSHNFKPGDFVKLKNRSTYDRYGIKKGAVAVVVATKDANPGNEQTNFNYRNNDIFIKWLGVDSHLHIGGLWDSGNFVDVKTVTNDINNAPFQIGDIVSVRYLDGLFMVVYTDWHRDEAHARYTKYMHSVIDDEDTMQAEALSKNPEYVYVVRINAENGEERSGGYVSNSVTLVKSRQDIEKFCEE